MATLNAKKRETKTPGEINKLRLDGFVPGILYGGSEQNKKISLNKNSIKNLINSENFFSVILNLEIDGKEEKVLPRDISFDPLFVLWIFLRSTSPLFGVIWPEINWINEDFPLPFGPISKIFSPSLIIKFANNSKEELLNFNEVFFREIHDILSIYISFFS